MTITINGQVRSLEGLVGPVELGLVVEALGLKGDRVAVECNGEIAPRSEWSSVMVNEGDRLEIVHFVGGGSSSISEAGPSATPQDDKFNVGVGAGG